MPLVQSAKASGEGCGDEADLSGQPKGDPVQIYYETYGSGERKVVFIMGESLASPFGQLLCWLSASEQYSSTSPSLPLPSWKCQEYALDNGI